MKAVIGLVAGSNPKLAPGKHIVNTPYIDAVIQAGGVPVLIPADADAGRAADYIDLLDGLLVPGGEDVTPLLYGQQPVAAVTYMNEDKDRMELELIRLAVERHLPVFGICRGMQIINVCFGGTLYQDLPSQYPGCGGHSQDMAIRSQLTHQAQAAPGSLMAELFGEAPFGVNSYHHQAVCQVAPGFQVTATAMDGVIEAMEDRERNIYAVQWHPEELVGRYEPFRGLFARLIELAGSGNHSEVTAKEKRRRS